MIIVELGAGVRIKTSASSQPSRTLYPKKGFNVRLWLGEGGVSAWFLFLKIRPAQLHCMGTQGTGLTMDLRIEIRGKFTVVDIVRRVN